MKVALTGASGHVGANITRQLLGKGIRPQVLVRNDRKAVEGLNVETIAGDVLNPESLDRLVAGASVVIHSAALISISGDPDGSVFRTNVEGTQNVVNACLKAGVKRLVHISSVHAFQQLPKDQALNEEREKVGESGFAYDRSKVAGENVVRKSVDKGLEVIILNPTAIIGPYDFKPSFMGKALWEIYQGKIPAMISGGFDWVDVRDVADAAIQAMEKGESGEHYLISGHYLPVRELAATLCRIYDRKPPGMVLPQFVARLGLPFIQLYVSLTHRPPLYTRESLDTLRDGNPMISCQKAQKALGYRPRPVEETLKDTMDWMLTHRI
ncbi:MAG: NAD-dependent epimerase/dehydratase family protein [Bacteroidia bacterium]|nr:NAD-dependent epimerase/dehydratase family protein [Bacteroidia bacterium]